MISLKKCKNGYAYKIDSRNLSIGVFNRVTNGFVGVRYKFGDEFLFEEFHYDTGEPYGTVYPKKELEQCPVKDLREYIGSYCGTCRKKLNWVDDPNWEMKKKIHFEEFGCKKLRTCAEMNSELFEYLKKLKENNPEN